MGEPVQLHDTHAHLDDPAFGDDLDGVLVRADQAGVKRILSVGSDLSSSKIAVSLARQHRAIWAAVGVHPNEAEKFEREAPQIEDTLNGPKVVAVGEIGLDFSSARPSRHIQIQAFESQMELALQRNLPVSIHNRSADQEVLEVARRVPVTAVLHCYSGSWDFALCALDAGMYLSFAGNLTYPKATELRRVASEIPIERALIETDSPVLAPQARRGKRNEPGLLIYTFDAFASLRNMAPGEAASVLRRNGNRVFGWETD